MLYQSDVISMISMTTGLGEATLNLGLGMRNGLPKFGWNSIFKLTWKEILPDYFRR